MKKYFIILAVIATAACNNSNTDKTTATDSTKQTTTAKDPAIKSPSVSNPPSSTSPNVTFTVEGKDFSGRGSALVSKDKDKLKPGADWFCMLNASGASDSKLTLNFIFDLKPGTYPIVGTSLLRKEGGNDQIFGGILGGKSKITDRSVTLTECTDLGSNNAGGHRWKIAGTFQDIVIPAMGIMLMDKTKNHPKEIKIDKGNFSNITFDDNADELLKKAFQQIKK